MDLVYKYILLLLFWIINLWFLHLILEKHFDSLFLSQTEKNRKYAGLCQQQLYIERYIFAFKNKQEGKNVATYRNVS